MKWPEIQEKYPNKFILIGDIVEEKISGTKCRILEGKILKISDSAIEIRREYQNYKNKGLNVLYSLPGTPKEFVVENVAFMGVLE